MLGILKGEMGDFYLAGGTALARYYFHHRESVDLDFFTQTYDPGKVDAIVKIISRGLDQGLEMTASQADPKFAKMMVFNLPVYREFTLKIDFVQDLAALLKPARDFDGINVLSLEDIFLRKIYAVAGGVSGVDAIGRNTMAGGRMEAKDFFDLYILSSTFMRLSAFTDKFLNAALKEGIIRWFRTYNRLEMKTALLEIKAETDINYNAIEKHFQKEVDLILKKELEIE